MHLEILVEDSSGKKLLEYLLPKILGLHGEIHTWKIHSYKGCGRIPKDLQKESDPSKRILLNRLPKLLAGYGNTPGIDAVIVVVDTDKNNCVDFLKNLKELHKKCKSAPNTLFRLAIEEIEAWYTESSNFFFYPP